MFESWSVSQIVTHTANIFSKHGNSEDLDQSWQLFGSQTLLHFPLHHWGLKKNRPEETTKIFPLGCFKTAFFPEEKTHTISGFLTARIQTHCTTLPRNVWYLGMRQKSSFFAEFGERLPTTTLLSTNWGFMDALNHQLNLFNILTFWPSMINLLKEMDYTLMIISLFVLLRFHIAIHDGHETPEWEANPSSCKRNIKYMDTSKKHKTRTRCWIWNKGHGWMHLRDSQNQVWFTSIHPYIYTYEQI